MPTTKRPTRKRAPRVRQPAPATYSFTADDIVRERDTLRQGWRRVAVNLGLENSRQARKAYTELTGVPYRESVIQVVRSKATNRSVLRPEWDDDTDQDEIIEVLGDGGRTILVSRKYGPDEEIVVRRLVEFEFVNGDGPLNMTFVEDETGGTRCVRVSSIEEIH